VGKKEKDYIKELEYLSVGKSILIPPLLNKKEGLKGNN